MIKIAFNIFATLFFFLSSITLYAQDAEKNEERSISIIDELNSHKSNEGSVSIMLDESIRHIIGVHKSTAEKYKVNLKNLDSGKDDNTNQVRARGWKIQVYSGNNQSKSKREAENRRQMVRNEFSDLEVVINYNSPVWRVLAGNFASRENAERMLDKMKAMLPSLAREMYIVQEIIKRPSR